MAMNLKSAASIALLAATSSLGAFLLPPSQAQAKTDEAISPQQIIRYECYDQNGNVAFVTVDPYETVGWPLGCREVPYVDTADNKPNTDYYQCYDGNGNIAFTTTNEQLGDRAGLDCRKIGFRDITPVRSRPLYYECLNNNGEVAFVTYRHQDTQGWVPNCREVRTLLTTPAAPMTTPVAPSR